MTYTAITGYQFSLFLHITAVVVGLGANFAQSVMFPVAMKLDKRHLPYVHRLALVLNRYFGGPALLIILITGFYQQAEGNWDLGDFWISGTLAIVVIIGGITGAYFIPTDQKLGAMVEREIAAAGGADFELSAEYQASARREGMVGALVGLLVVLAIYLMVIKPGV